MRNYLPKSALIISTALVTASSSIILSSITKMNTDYDLSLYFGVLASTMIYVGLSLTTINRISSSSEVNRTQEIIDTILSSTQFIDGNEPETEILPENNYIESETRLNIREARSEGQA